MSDINKATFAKARSNDVMSGRCISLDTETTGLDPVNGDRIIEVGCVEILNGKVTGKNLHFYVDPEREIEYEAYKVHGMDRDRLRDLSISEDDPKQRVRTFKDRQKEFLDFIGDSPLVIHNAPFDMGFLNMEFERLGFGPGYLDKLKVFDTLHYAKNLFPGGKNGLDHLCKKYGVDNSKRDLHGALLDAELLASVFIKMVTPDNDHVIHNSLPESAKLMVNGGIVPIKKTPINPRLNERLDQLSVKADEGEIKNYREMAKNQGLEIF